MENFLGTIGHGFLILAIAWLVGFVTTFAMIRYTSWRAGIRITDMPKESLDQARGITFVIFLLCTIAFSYYTWS